MLTQIHPLLGFHEEVKKLSQYPEITASDTAIISFKSFDIEYRNPNYSDHYDWRLLESFSNHIRKLVILDEPISLKNIHKRFGSDLELNKIYSSLQNYLGKDINSTTQFSFTPYGILDETSVRSLMNDYFAAIVQHSKPDAQKRIDEINSITYGFLTEMLRIMLIEIKKYLDEYVETLKKTNSI